MYAMVQKLPNKVNLAFPCSPIVDQGDQFIFKGGMTYLKLFINEKEKLINSKYLFIIFTINIKGENKCMNIKVY